MSKPPPPTPEPRPLSFIFSAERVKLALTSPALVLGILALALVPGAMEWLRPARQPQLQAPALPAWSPTDAGALLARMLPGKLPPPGEGWKTNGCDSDLGEQERNGACWMETKVPPPCPSGKLWEDEGRCWRPIPKTARAPTSGEPQRASVAGP